jgi:hypothetical protein
MKTEIENRKELNIRKKIGGEVSRLEPSRTAQLTGPTNEARPLTILGGSRRLPRATKLLRGRAAVARSAAVSPTLPMKAAALCRL